MKRIEEFVKYGKKFVCFDLSFFKTNDEFKLLIEMAKPVIEKYKKHSIYAIANLEGIRFDTETKELLADWMRHNSQYVKHCVLFGMDGIKKIMLEAALSVSGRYNVSTAATKEQAIELLKQRDWAKLDRWAQT